MFNVGMSEMVLVFIVALIVFGPDKLPEIARTLGKSINEIKKPAMNLSKRRRIRKRTVRGPSI